MSPIVSRGTVRIDVERCKGCGFCVEYCPRDVLAMSEGFNAKGYHTPELLDEPTCVNCGLCEMICPEFAIFVVDAGSAALGASRAPATAEVSP